MVHKHILQDESLRFEGKRLLSATSSPYLLGLEGPLKEDPSVSPDLSTKDDLVRFAPLTTEAITQRRASGIEAHEGAFKGRSYISESEGITAVKSGFDLASFRLG